MRVTALVSGQINKLRTVFPMQVEPPFGMTDFIGEYASSAMPQISSDGTVVSANDALSNGLSGEYPSGGGMEFDPLAKIVYPRALFVLHDQVLTSNYYGTVVGADANPAVSWFDFETDSSDYSLFTEERKPGYKAASAIFNDSTARDFRIYGEAPLPCQGFTAILQTMTPDDQGNTSSLGEIAWRVTGGNRTPRWYLVSWTNGEGIKLGYNDHVDAKGNPKDFSWQLIDTPKIGAARADVLVPRTGFYDPRVEPEEQILEVRLLGGVMRLTFGSEDTPFMWPHPQTDDTLMHDWMIDKWQVAGSLVNSMRWSVHLTKFGVRAKVVSHEINLGFVPDSAQLANLYWRIHYAPNFGSTSSRSDQHQTGWKPPNCGAQVALHEVDGTVIRYSLFIGNDVGIPVGNYRGQLYAHLTAAVRAISFNIQGITHQSSSSPIILGAPGQPPFPEVVDVFHEFDVNNLTIRSRAVLTFNNFTARWTNGLGTGIVDTGGHRAIELDFGIAGFSSGLRREFTGIFNTEFEDDFPGGGNDRVSIHCADCWEMLDVPTWNLPWFDGMNVYWVIAYLAHKGGITDSQLDFIDLVPSNPYEISPGLPGHRNYFLPLGPAGTALTRFGNGQVLRDIMLKISVSIGFCLFFDVTGKLKFFKFQLPAGAAVKTFNYRAGAVDGSVGIDEAWSGTYRSGLRETRNSVTAIGVNALSPLWYPIVAHGLDNASVFDEFADNYIGFVKPVVWVDNLFANAPFAQAGANSMLTFLRTPDRQLDIKTWYPSSPVYPGDQIRLVYPRSAATLYPFFVTATHTTIRKGALPTMAIQGRVVPQGLEINPL